MYLLKSALILSNRFQNLLKRALHFLKRALHFHKRAPYPYKRVLHLCKRSPAQIRLFPAVPFSVIWLLSFLCLPFTFSSSFCNSFLFPDQQTLAMFLPYDLSLSFAPPLFSCHIFFCHLFFRGIFFILSSDSGDVFVWREFAAASYGHDYSGESCHTPEWVVSQMCVRWLKYVCHWLTRMCVTWLISVCVTHINESCHTHVWES